LHSQNGRTKLDRLAMPERNTRLWRQLLCTFTLEQWASIDATIRICSGCTPLSRFHTSSIAYKIERSHEPVHLILHSSPPCYNGPLRVPHPLRGVRHHHLGHPEVVGQFLSLKAHPNSCKPFTSVLLLLYLIRLSTIPRMMRLASGGTSGWNSKMTAARSGKSGSQSAALFLSSKVPGECVYLCPIPRVCS
jgi:hypothetical protein